MSRHAFGAVTASAPAGAAVGTAAVGGALLGLFLGLFDHTARMIGVVRPLGVDGVLLAAGAVSVAVGPLIGYRRFRQGRWRLPLAALVAFLAGLLLVGGLVCPVLTAG